jgi:hypothetical protein
METNEERARRRFLMRISDWGLPGSIRVYDANGNPKDDGVEWDEKGHPILTPEQQAEWDEWYEEYNR